MSIQRLLAVSAIVLIAASPAFARGGGGGGGGFGGGGSADRGGGYAGDRGGPDVGRPQNDADRALGDQARRECNGPKYPSGATPRINYDADTFTCFEPGSSRH